MPGRSLHTADMRRPSPRGALVSVHLLFHPRNAIAPGLDPSAPGASVPRKRGVTLTRNVKIPVKASDILQDKPRLATGNGMKPCRLGHGICQVEGESQGYGGFGTTQSSGEPNGKESEILRRSI